MDKKKVLPAQPVLPYLNFPKMNMLFSLFLRKPQWLYRLKYFKQSIFFLS